MQDINTLPITVVEAGDKLPLKKYLMDFWKYRLLLWVFTARDIKVRYAQTFLGLIWIFLSPLFTVGVFTFVFGVMVKIPSDGLPYLLFYLVAIVPWYAFVAMLNQTMGSVEGNAGLVSKIYFPRLILGCSYALSSGLDYLVGFGMIVLCSSLYGKLNIQLFILFPFLFLIQSLFAMGIGLFLAPWSSRYRDIRLFIPLATQLYYFSNPILYSSTAAPHWLQWWYKFNPMSMIITSYREALKGNWPQLNQVGFGVFAAVLVFIIGFSMFRSKKQTMVDLI